MSTKRKVNSWDIFDTLIGRRCFYPDEIFKIIEIKSGINNYFNIRKHCESITQSNYDDIYNKMNEVLGLEKSESLKKMEFETELEYIFPIQQNMNMVVDGDILVSDNYYSKEYILKLLIKAGLNKNVEIYVTYGGKSNGSIWNNLKNTYDIVKHTGDNVHSDINMAKMNGIPTTYFNKEFNNIESYLSNNGHPNMAKFCRMLRLKNLYNTEDPKFELWNLESNFNVPILLLYMNYLNNYCIKNNYKTILFCTRDCCHLYKLFKHFYPGYESIYFHSSREAYIKKSDDYKNYVLNMLRVNGKDKTVVVDLCGTGNSGNEIFKELDYPKRFFFWYISGSHTGKNIDYMIQNINCNNSLLEILNYDKIGSLSDVQYINDNHIDIRKDIKYDHKLLDFMDSIIENIIKYGEIPQNINLNVVMYLIKYFDNQNEHIKQLFNHDGNE